MNADKLRVMLGVWLGVYPAVLVLTYALDPLDLATWLSVLISTSVTVPLITFLVVPLCREAIAHMDRRPKEDIEG
ncbi:hypothetical protein [Acuticoccus sp.]|uniref:hypothetical protein n=1 Tax=Acuticoccus sp. TaxID=1904378 RepID=UPI003B52D249